MLSAAETAGLRVASASRQSATPAATAYASCSTARLRSGSSAFSLPLASDLNFVAGQTVPNLVVVKLSAAGQINIYNGFGSTDVIVDVEGWFG